jgi:hypothetical protein
MITSKVFVIFVVFLCGLTGIVAASSAYELPLTDVQTIVDFQSTTYGGSTNTAQYCVTFADKTSLLLRVGVEHPFIEECNEWQALCSIDGTPVAITEVSPGLFESEPKIVEKGAHSVQVMLTSVPNIYPDNYGFSIEFNYTTEKKDVPDHTGAYASARRHVSYTPPLTTAPSEPTMTTPTPTPPVEDEDVDNSGNFPWMFIIIIGSVLVILVIIVGYWYTRP